MKIQVNGAPMQLDEQATVLTVLENLGIPKKYIAVEQNGELIDEEYSARPVREGDRLEIVRFVGGG